MQSKQCTDCLLLLPLESFHKHPHGKDGRRPQCKECRSIRRGTRRRWPVGETGTKPCPRCRKVLPLSSYHKDIRRRFGVDMICKECKKAKDHLKFINMSEEQKEKKRTQTRANHPKYRAKIREWWRNNPQKIKEYNTRNRANHPEYDAKKQINRKEKFTEMEINDLSHEQWLEILQAYGMRCAYCDKKAKKLTKDHIVSVSKGGNHTYTNIVPCCRSCNSKKHTGPPLRQVQPLLLTIAPARKKGKSPSS